MAGLSYAFDANAGETPQTVQQKRQLADALAARIFGRAPQNVGEGLNAIGQALIARTMGQDADAAQKAGQATIPSWLGGSAPASPAAGIASAITGQPATPAVPSTPSGAMASAPMGNIPPVAPTDTTGKIYSNDEPSPLDPPSGADRQAMIQTILGEAGNNPQERLGVASVIRNRAVDGGYGGDTPSQVVTAPNQFEPWNTVAGRTRMAAAAADPKQAAAADAAISAAYGEGGNAPNDPTEGKTMFFSPGAQAALGRPAPSWAQGPGQMIGQTAFYDDNSDLPAGSQPTQGTPAPGTPAVQQPAPGTAKNYGGAFPNVSNDDLTKAAVNPWLPATTRQLLTAEITRRATVDQQANDPLRQLQIKKAQQDLEKPDETFGVIGQDPNTGKSQYGFINTKTGTARPYNIPQNSNASQTSIQEAMKAGVKGDDLYQYLPPDRAKTVKAMIEGRMPPPSTTAMRSPATMQLIDAANAIDPGFDATTWKSRSTFNQQFGSQAPSSIGGQKVLMGTALGHLGEVADSAAKLDNVNGLGIAKLGHLANYAKNQTTEQAAIANALEDKVAKFSGEVGKLYSGSQGGGVHEREDTRNRLGSNLTAAELAAGLEASKDLILSKQKALADQASTIFGPERSQKFDFIGPEGRDAIAKIDTAIAKLRGQTEGQATPSGANAPAANQAPAAAPIKEGATIINPQTGERRILQGGKWVPVT
jgi:hypothetical protein